MSPSVQTFFCIAAVIGLLSIALWLVSLAIRDASVVDIFWGIFQLVAIGVAYEINHASHTRAFLLASLVSLWGFRLSVYLAKRNLGHGEDRRYQAFRKKWGRKFWWLSFFYVFLFQAVLATIIASPIIAVFSIPSPRTLGIFDFAAVVLFLLGFLFEAIADWQMAHFKRDPANHGRVMNRGLWRYSRHPNYFGEFCLWWGIGLIALAHGTPWALISPALVTFLLLRVSGVTMLEETIIDRRPEYAHYKKTTSSFFPLPPRQMAS